MERKLAQRNLLVAAVHLTSFVSLLILSLTYSDVARRVSLWFDTDRGSSIEKLAEFSIAVSILPFPAITAIFHLIAAERSLIPWNEAAVLRRGVNAWRWLEYSITNGLITFSLCVLAGAGGLPLVIVAVLSNVLMQYFGYLHEALGRHCSIEYLAMGFLPWVQIWLVTILPYYTANASSAPTYESFAILGSFVLSLAFVVPLIWRLQKPNTPKNNFALENMYIVLSLVAKLYLDWTVTIGYIVEADY